MTSPQQVVAGLVGRPLVAHRRSYGDELRLDFGRTTSFRHPRLAGARRGEWVLGTRAGEWRWVGPQGQDDVEPAAGIIVTRAVVSFPALDLLVEFDDGSRLAVPGPLDDDAGIEAWELFTPDRRVLAVGPGRRWTLTSVDGPA